MENKDENALRNEEAEKSETPAPAATSEETPAEPPRDPRQSAAERSAYAPNFTDANYVPRDQAPRAPRSYAYADPEMRENRQRWEQEERRNEKRARKQRRGMRAGGVILLCILFLLIGAGGAWYLTGGFHSFVSRFFTGEQTERAAIAEPIPERVPTEEEPEEQLPAAEEPAEQEERSGAPEKETLAPAPETPRNSIRAEESAGELFSGTEIYKLACQQVVGISTAVTYNTFYGPRSGTVSGTGFIITEDGYILTNHHVIEYAEEGGYPITVMLFNGDTYPATIIGFEDEDSDIAVLKIDAQGLEPAKLGHSEDMLVGETIYAVGNPLGELDYTMTKGMISAMDREIRSTDSSTGVSSSVNMFQIDAAVNSGNSGGPVYNTRGEVIGVVTAKYADTYQEMGIEGLGFAIPIDDAVSIANELIESGYVRGKAYMGVSTKTMSSMYAQYYNVPEGAYVYAVANGSAAETAGLCMGDIITAIDKTEVSSVNDLTNALKNYAAGEEAEITVYRSGETITLTILFDEKQPETVAAEPTGKQPGSGNYIYGGFGGNGSNHN